MSSPELVPAPAPIGCCRVCGCTNDAPCRTASGDECMWVNRLQTLCNSDKCMREAARRARQEKRERREQVRAMVSPVIDKIRKQREERRRKRRPKGTKGRAA